MEGFPVSSISVTLRVYGRFSTAFSFFFSLDLCAQNKRREMEKDRTEPSLPRHTWGVHCCFAQQKEGGDGVEPPHTRS